MKGSVSKRAVPQVWQVSASEEAYGGVVNENASWGSLLLYTASSPALGSQSTFLGQLELENFHC